MSGNNRVEILVFGVIVAVSITHTSCNVMKLLMKLITGLTGIILNES